MTNQAIANLTESYARWRSRRVGQITDALEEQLMSEMLGSVTGKTLLDVGCGDGEFASELARRGAVVTGLDADPAMIAAARRRSKIETTQLRFLEGQAETLQFEDATFDSVIAVTVLCFVRDAARAVNEMARVLKTRRAARHRRTGALELMGRLPPHSSLDGPSNLARGDISHSAGASRSRRCRWPRRRARVGGGALPALGHCDTAPGPIDLWLGHKSTLGAAFIALSATKPVQ